MPAFPSSLAVSVPDTLAAVLSEAVFEQWLESLTTPVGLTVIGAGVLGLIVGWLTAGRRAPKEERSDKEANTPPELVWRHEKLVLSEREVAERERRRSCVIERASQLNSAESGLALLAAEVGEVIRESRQRVGSDLSRMKLIRERVHEVVSDTNGNGNLEAALEIADTQVSRLTELRDSMRNPSSAYFELEPALYAGTSSDEVEEALASIRSSFRELAADWDVLVREADRNLQQLLSGEESVALDPIRSFLLIDGGASESLDCEDLLSPAEAIGVLQESLARQEEAQEKLAPDSGFRPPIETNGSGLLPLVPGGNGATSTPPSESGEDSSEPVPEGGELLVFRSNDVGLWGKEVYRGANARAREIERLPAWAEWVSIRRLDTGARVFASLEGSSLQSSETASSSGFNASNELFYGARHLGLFSESCPNEVETRFTYGGWGFGHRVREQEEGSESQASGWDGKEIDSDTVFEIVLHQELPELGKDDRVLEQADESFVDGSSLAR